MTDTEREALRKTMIRAREAMTPEERAEKSARAMERIAGLEAFRRAETVMIYRAVRGELSPETLPGLPVSAGKRFAYPLCLPERNMAALIPGAWQTGPFGIPEPVPEQSEEVPPEALDLVICPGTAFDARGHRLGMGGGYYDRFLPRCTNAVIVMAAFEAQWTEEVPADSRDVPMALVVTEDRVYKGNLNFPRGILNLTGRLCSR